MNDRCARPGNLTRVSYETCVLYQDVNVRERLVVVSVLITNGVWPCDDKDPECVSRVPGLLDVSSTVAWRVLD